MITSYHDEVWDYQGRPDRDPSTGFPRVHVRRQTTDGNVIVWRLVRMQTPRDSEGRWRNMGTFIGSLPGQGFRPAPERYGKLLSNSRTDLMLQSFAETGYPATGDFSHV